MSFTIEKKNLWTLGKQAVENKLYTQIFPPPIVFSILFVQLKIDNFWDNSVFSYSSIA
jgi:hypothetical protein